MEDAVVVVCLQDLVYTNIMLSSDNNNNNYSIAGIDNTTTLVASSPCAHRLGTLNAPARLRVTRLSVPPGA